MTNWTSKRIAAEYRAAYAHHMAKFANGGNVAEMMASADNLRALKAAHVVAVENERHFGSNR